MPSRTRTCLRRGTELLVGDQLAVEGIGDPAFEAALAAVLAGARSFAGIAGWATDLPVWARPRLGITKRAPSLPTIRRTLLLVDPDVLDAVLHAWREPLAAPSEVPESLRAVAVDGKTGRGARTSGDTRVHLSWTRLPFFSASAAFADAAIFLRHFAACGWVGQTGIHAFNSAT